MCSLGSLIIKGDHIPDKETAELRTLVRNHLSVEKMGMNQVLGRHLPSMKT
jgi:hypothetical protein